MRFHNISLSFLALIIATASTPITFSFSALPGELLVLAQTPEAQKAEADRLLKQGSQQLHSSQFAAAIQSWQQAVIIYREIKDRKGEAQSLGNVGNAYQSLRDYPKAIEYYQQAFFIFREIKDSNGEGMSLFNIGSAYSSLENYPKTIEYYEQSLAIFREIKNREGEVKALDNLGIAYSSIGNYPKAIEYYQQSLAIARETKDPQAEGNTLDNLGIAYSFLGNYPKAIEYYEQSLAIFRKIPDRQGQGSALGNLGNAYKSLGDYKKALEYLQQSLAIAREIPDRQGEGQSLGDIGGVYSSLGNYPKAIEYLQQSLAIAREIKDPNTESTALSNLGNAYESLGNYPKAIEYHEQSLAIAREINDRNGQGKSLGNLGNTYQSLGDYPKTIDYHQQSLAIFREIKDPQGEARALTNLGIVYKSLGDYPKAIDYHQQSLAIFREIKDRQGEGNALGNLGIAYFFLGEYPKAIEYHQQSLAILREIKDRQGEGAALNNLGNAYDTLENYPKALESRQQSLAIAREIKDRRGEGVALDNLGGIYSSLGDYKKAIEYHQQSLAIAREIQNRFGEGSSLNNLGFAFYKRGNLPAAEKTLDEGIQVWESLRDQKLDDSNKVSIFETQSLTYRTLQQVLIAQNKIERSLEIAERGRARAFVELISSRWNHGNTQAKSPQAPTIAQIKQIAKAQNATLVQYSIIYDTFKVTGKQQTQASELFIWVIKPTGEVTFRKADLKPLWQKDNTTLDNLVTSSRESIGVRGRGAIDVAYNPNSPKAKNRLKQLHELLINPIADLLPKNPDEPVIFVPQSSLFFVPFAALQDEQGKYLIEKHTILTAPAIQVLDLTRQQRQRVSGNQALVLGNPTMPSVAPSFGAPPQQLPPLPGAETEAKEIAQLLHTKAITGKDATKAAFIQRLPQARLIHLATHGLLDDFKGLGVPGAVALAPDGKDNGLLTANEILDLKINAELVVLSACDTGQGKLTGDGVIGLSRALISAGASSVIVTLWSIPDSPSALLMGEFYRQLQKNPDKAKALRQAMLTTMKNHPNPSAWAAFTLIGEAK